MNGVQIYLETCYCSQY